MDTFTLYVAVRCGDPVDEHVLEVVGRSLRPDDDDLCLWRDEDDDALLRISTDTVAADLQSALRAGHVLAAEVIALAPEGAQPLEVVSMTEEEQIVWRSEP